MPSELLILRVLVLIFILLTLISLVLDVWILLRKPAETVSQFPGNLFPEKHDSVYLIDLTLHCRTSMDNVNITNSNNDITQALTCATEFLG